MKTVGSILAVLVLFCLIQGLAVADDQRIDTAKLIGKWKVTKVDGKDVKDEGKFEDRLELEFTRDKKTLEWRMRIVSERGAEKGIRILEKAKIEVYIFGNKWIWTIKSLTDDSLTLFFEEGPEVPLKGQTIEFKRVKKSDEEKSGEEKTLNGTITCAKCDLKKETVCATVIVVKEDGKQVIYYFDKDSHKKNHPPVCQQPKEGTVTGTVGKDGDKHTIEVTKVQFK
jgi:hypothetical protein